MLKVDCYSGYKRNEKPVAFSLIGCHYEVKEVIDRWYGEGSSYFKVKADDDNIYLLKYDEWKDHWDLVFYQNPEKVEALLPPGKGLNMIPRLSSDSGGSKRISPLN